MQQSVTQQPVLPRKPASLNSNTAAAHHPQSIDKQNISYESLDYPLISPNITAERFSFAPMQPQYFHELSSSKLRELMDEYQVLKGLVLSKYSKAYETLAKEILEILDKQISFVEELISNYELKMIPEVDKLNGKLVSHNNDLENFNHLQVMMYDKMNNLSKTAVIDTLRQTVKKSDQDSLEIVNNARGKSGGLDSDELDDFIQKYKIQRQDYYLKKEKLARALQERVGGLD